MPTSPSTVLGLAVAAGLIGATTVVATTSSSSVEGLATSVQHEAVRAFEPEPWNHLPLATVIVGAAALALTGADKLLSRRKLAAEAPRPLEGGVKDRLAEVERRLRRANQDVVTGAEELLRGAIALGASDVHVSPGPDGVQLTYRVEGQLLGVASLPSAVHGPLATRLKVLAHLEPYVRTTPQDGRLAVTLDGTPLEARLSTLPTEQGERLVLRILRGAREVPKLDGLDMSTGTYDALVDILQKPQGLFLVTGPVGSGKTTLLYAALGHIAETRKTSTAMVTLEDPIELELAFATQTQVNPKGGLDFASTLRSVLRQDPNVLMVGEIRDAETAEIAAQAGLTGHLILSSVHGQSAAGAFARLIEMGVEPFVLASAALGSMSQRLVRQLCSTCKVVKTVDPLVEARFKKAGVPIPAGKYYEPVGCDLCEGQGFSGRLPITEVCVVNDAIKKAIHDKAPTHQIEAAAREAGMVPLLVDGLTRARAGETSLAEVVRVAG